MARGALVRVVAGQGQGQALRQAHWGGRPCRARRKARAMGSVPNRAKAVVRLEA